MKNTIQISHLNLEECRKDVDFATGEPYNPEQNDEHYSEYAFALALNVYPEGEEVPWEAFTETLDYFKYQQHMMAAVENGDIAMFWNDETESVNYVLTEQGQKKIQ